MDTTKKYPKSKNNFQCLGPCYNPGTMVIHPTQLEYVTEGPLPFCPVDEWIYTDAKTKETYKKATDICFNPTESENMSNSQLEMNILIPYIDFNSEQFLKIYYKIFSFDNAIDWIETNDHVSMTTKERIVNSALRAYGNNIDILDIRFAKFYIKYIKKAKMKKIYEVLHKYIGIDKKTSELYLEKPETNNIDKYDNITERTNYIINTFLTNDEIVKFLQKILKYEHDYNETDDNLEWITDMLCEYLKNKIKMSLNN